MMLKFIDLNLVSIPGVCLVDNIEFADYGFNPTTIKRRRVLTSLLKGKSIFLQRRKLRLHQSDYYQLPVNSALLRLYRLVSLL